MDIDGASEAKRIPAWRRWRRLGRTSDGKGGLSLLVVWLPPNVAHDGCWGRAVEVTQRWSLSKLTLRNCVCVCMCVCVHFHVYVFIQSTIPAAVTDLPCAEELVSFFAECGSTAPSIQPVAILPSRLYLARTTHRPITIVWW